MQKNVQTIVEVNGSNFAADGYGQETIEKIRSEVPRKTPIKLVGFLKNGHEFIPVDLTSHWNRTIVKK